jgi:tRNA modification GTPase
MGLPELRAAMLDVVRSEIPDESNVLLSNVRHYEAMQRVQQALDNVHRGLEDGTPADLVAVDLRDALYHLGTITGEVTSDEVLGNIFGRFCIGK